MVDLFPHGRGLLAIRNLGAFVIAGCLLVACGPSLQILRESGLPEQASVDGVPIIPQTEYHCGPASLAAILRWSGADTSQALLVPLVYTPERQGTFAVDLARETRLQGRLAYQVRPRLEALLEEVAAGHPVLLLENRGLKSQPVWHYSVLVGFELDTGRVALHDGGHEPRHKSLKNLARTWERGGHFSLLALPPGRLPAGEDPHGILAALADLEEVGQVHPALAGYEVFLERWPTEWRAAFGLANAQRSLGESIAAKDALELARNLAPDRPEPLNNLSLLAWEAGDAKGARTLATLAVERAVALEMDTEPFEDTLRTVWGESSQH